MLGLIRRGMKFETLLETLELREFRGQYLPYVALHKQLLSVTTPPQRRLFRSLSSVSTRSEEAKQPQDADNPMKKWRETLQQDLGDVQTRLAETRAQADAEGYNHRHRNGRAP